jgi:uncharacterized membrane protein
MNNLIERYINEVIRRLPEKERDEVREELCANIFDMLSEDPAEEEISKVLESLGEPRKLAEQYRQNPRYLISPANYDDYIRSIKLSMPIMAAISIFLGLMINVIQLMSIEIISDAYETVPTFGGILGGVITNGFGGLLVGFFLVTVAFALIERTGFNYETYSGKDTGWTVTDLPELKPENKYKLPLLDSVIDLGVSISITFVFILLVTDNLPFSPIRLNLDGITHISPTIFTPEFARIAVPVAGVVMLLTFIEHAFKIVSRSWTLPVCIVTVLSNIIAMVLILFLVTRADILSPEFVEFMESLAERISGLFWLGSRQLTVTVIALIAVADGVINSGIAVYKTTRNYIHKESMVE